jgi:hypothetical protein
VRRLRKREIEKNGGTAHFRDRNFTSAFSVIYMESLVSQCLSQLFPINEPFPSSQLSLELLKSLISKKLLLPVESHPTCFYRPPRRLTLPRTPISIKKRSLAIKSTPISVVKKKFKSPSAACTSSTPIKTNIRDLENEIRTLGILVVNKDQVILSSLNVLGQGCYS